MSALEANENECDSVVVVRKESGCKVEGDQGFISHFTAIASARPIPFRGRYL